MSRTTKTDIPMPHALKTYNVVYAQDVPHYARADINAYSGAEAVAKAKDYPRVRDLDFNDADWTNPVCLRIVSIEDGDGKMVAEDVPLDNYYFRYCLASEHPIYDAAPDLLSAARSAENWLSEYEQGPDTGLEGLLAELRTAIAKTATAALLSPIKNTPNRKNPFTQLLVEVQELLRNAEYHDGYGRVLTQDCEAVEFAWNQARIIQNELLRVCMKSRAYLRAMLSGRPSDIDALLPELDLAVSNATGGPA